MSAQPWMKFYPTDWRADPALRTCSLAARGLWIEMLAIMHEAEPRGHMLINGRAVPTKHLASLVGASEEQVAELLAKLSDAGVYSTKRNGVLYSRRMERDEQKSRKLRDNGKLGGNPSLRKQTIIEPLDNPPDKPQKPEARSQRPDEENEETIKKTRGAIFDELTKTVDADRAVALIDHRKALGAELTPYAASLLGADLAKCPEPNAAADAMIKNGWQGFSAEMFNAERPARKRVANGNRSPPATGSAIPYAQRQQRILEQQRQHEQALQSPVVPPSREQQEALDRFRAKQALKKAVH